MTKNVDFLIIANFWTCLVLLLILYKGRRAQLYDITLISLTLKYTMKLVIFEISLWPFLPTKNTSLFQILGIKFIWQNMSTLSKCEHILFQRSKVKLLLKFYFIFTDAKVHWKKIHVIFCISKPHNSILVNFVVIYITISDFIYVCSSVIFYITLQ